MSTASARRKPCRCATGRRDPPPSGSSPPRRPAKRRCPRTTSGGHRTTAAVKRLPPRAAAVMKHRSATSCDGTAPAMLRRGGSVMNLIERDQLKQKLDRGDDFRLVMAMDEWAYRAKHIPGSIHIHDRSSAYEQLRVDDEIVVYCTGPDCVGSRIAYAQLEANGFTHVTRFAGGLAEWEAAGYPLEGALVDAPDSPNLAMRR
ncbi:MAG: rhodanese-like domain-containing protein [Myxococcales bacterium FL481]|nr:MAG: rhodanese-like domain-containing protein [Myxococcales bacterium FL481]